MEQFDRDENEDENGDRNGQEGVPEMVDWTQGHPRYDDESLWDDIMVSIDKVQVAG